MSACRIPPPGRRSTLILFLSLIPACQRDKEQRSPLHVPSSVRSDSLVARSGDSLEIWFTLTRVGHAPDGTACAERGLEIRREGSRTPVPLLYTGAAPILLDGSTMRAELWNHCRPVAVYRVDLKTGRPVREGDS
jgi:hypothetical protein